MDERAASFRSTPDDLTATSYVPQLLGGHLTYSARDLAEATALMDPVRNAHAAVVSALGSLSDER